MLIIEKLAHLLEAKALVKGQGIVLQQAGGKDHFTIALVSCKREDSPDQGFGYPLMQLPTPESAQQNTIIRWPC